MVLYRTAPVLLAADDTHIQVSEEEDRAISIQLMGSSWGNLEIHL
ncbi:MAG TPA: hypothetical protein VFA10_29495 [Ktedonobacteraceae bacterium]|nr:hypothetical protein [Ktedonobacteraceae bacterium]